MSSEYCFVSGSQIQTNNAEIGNHQFIFSQEYPSNEGSETFKVSEESLYSEGNVLTLESDEDSNHLSSVPDHSDDSINEYYIEYESVLNCRTCLCDLEPDCGYPITYKIDGKKSLKEMIAYCIPQIASTLFNKDVICDQCLESIKFCVNFIEKCLKVEAELSENNYITDPMENNQEESSESDTFKHVSLDHSYIQEPTVQETLGESPKQNTDYIVTESSRHECSKCNRLFKTKNYLLDHTRKMHSENSKSTKKGKIPVFDCDYCDKTFLTKMGYNLHLQFSHLDKVEVKKDSLSDGGYTCKVCKNNFISLADLLEHKYKEHRIVCKTCHLRFNSKNELNAHMDIHTSSHLCEVCGKGFHKRANLKVHLLTHNSNSHLCHECGRGFKSKVSLSLHLKHHSPELKFRCDQCPSSFQRKYRLELHKKVRHLGIREYVCSICNKIFCYKANLLSHYRLKHSEVKPYQCEKCGIRFARPDYLKRHTNCGDVKPRQNCFNTRRKYRYRRGESGPIICKLCEKVFKDVHMLRLHVKTHTQLRKYPCRVCTLTFTTGSNRDRHEKVHNNSVMMYRCEVCFKRMDTQEALDEHCTLSHETSKKYKCHVCDDLFGRKYLLHSHVAEKHGDVEDFEKEKEVLYKVVLQDYLIDQSNPN